jgi:hypothetical protein
MKCAEFQAALANIIDSGGDRRQQAHLKICRKCSELVSELKYIADVAKRLLPMEDPPARVWSSIQRSLQQDDPGRCGPGGGPPFPQSRNGKPGDGSRSPLPRSEEDGPAPRSATLKGRILKFTSTAS